MLLKPFVTLKGMKHTTLVTVVLLGMFVISQIVGLGFIAASVDVIRDPSGQVTISYPATAVGERPDIEGGKSVAFLVGAIIVGTIALLILIRFKKKKLWKVWYFLAVWISVAIALGVFLPPLAASVLGILLAALKVWKPEAVLQNGTEVLMYTGLAILFVPILDVWWAILLLVIISFYDMYAVWKSKHMVKLATFTSESRLFAGFSIPYKKQHDHTKLMVNIPRDVKLGSENKSASNVAILGGGDITFPLFFSGAAFNWLLEVKAASLVGAYIGAFFVSLCAGIGLAWLLIKSEKNKFYPAMPPITIGCLVGFGIMYLLYL